MRLCSWVATLLLLLLCATSWAAARWDTEVIAGGGPDGLPAVDSNLGGPATLVHGTNGELYVGTMETGQLFRLDSEAVLHLVAQSDQIDTLAEEFEPPVDMALAPDGKLVMATDYGVYLWDPSTGEQVRIPEIDRFWITAVAVDAQGRIYYAEYLTGPTGWIRRYDPADGSETLIAGKECSSWVCTYQTGEGVPAVEVRLTAPRGLALDGQGHLYVSYDGSRVRRVDLTDGTIWSVAGTATAGFSGDGGPATEAQLLGPRDIEFDSLGSLYIADTGNDRIRRVDARTGIITTVAGNGEVGFSGDGGAATEAALDHPTGLALDASGNLSIADYSNLRVRRVRAADGRIDTLAGNGNLYYSGDGYPALQASIWGDQFIVDAAGNLIIAEMSGDRVRQVDVETGIVRTIVGTGESSTDEQPDGIPATEAIVPAPRLVGFDPEGNLYLMVGWAAHERTRYVDSQTGLIWTVPDAGRISFGPDGQVYAVDWHHIYTVDLLTGERTVIAGNGHDEPADEGLPALETGMCPSAIAIDDGGNVFYNDHFRNRIRKVDRLSSTVETVMGGGWPPDRGIPLGYNGTFVAPALGTFFEQAPNSLYFAPNGDLWFGIPWATSVSRLDFRTGLATHEIGRGTWMFGYSPPEPPTSESDRLIPRGFALGLDGTPYVRSARRYYRFADTNQPPVAQARVATHVTCESEDGAKVTLDGALSFDPDALSDEPTQLESYWWYEDFGGPSERVLAKGVVADVELGIGDHPITLVVWDTSGAWSSDGVDVRVTDDDDPDDDGIGSCSDTCPDAWNLDQLDSDGNGLGDSCDRCWQEGSADPDGDGACAPQDNCPDLANADQSDADADGVGDACDRCPEVFNPDQTAGESCVGVAPAVGECRSVTVDSAGERRRGRVMLGQIHRPVPTRLKLLLQTYSGWGGSDVFELYLNGGLLLTAPVTHDINDYFYILDQALIQSLWNQGGENEFRFVKDGDLSRVYRVRVEWEAMGEHQEVCIVGSGCDAPPSYKPEPVDYTKVFQHTHMVKTPLSTVSYGPDPLSTSFDLPAEGVDELRLCVSATKPDGGDALLAATRGAELIEIDPFSGSGSRRALMSVLTEDFAYDRSTGTAFASSPFDTFGVSFDIRDGTRTGRLVQLPQACQALQFVGNELFAGHSWMDYSGPQWEAYSWLTILDPDDGSTTSSGINLSNGFHEGMAYDVATDRLFALFSYSSSRLRQLDLETKEERFIGNPGVSLEGVAVGPDGLIYGVSTSNEDFTAKLYWLDQDDATATLVGDTGFSEVPALTFAGEQGAVDCIDFLSEGEQRLAVNASCGPPVAAAAPVPATECISAAGGLVTLDGTASTDPNSSPGTNNGIVAFDWYLNYGTAEEVHLGSGEQRVTPVPFGTHVVTLRVTNRFEEAATATTAVTVVDTQPPSIEVSLDPATLWPPNHRMVEVTALVTATDNCGSPDTRLISVTSSELDDAPGGGDGHTVGDIQGAEPGNPDLTIALRAERSGNGTGRVYEVVYQTTDLVGATAEATARAVVPHSQAGVIEPVDLTVHETESGTVASWGDVPGATYYHVIRGELGSIGLAGSSLDLGTVRCVESGSLDTSTQGLEDQEVPPAGSAYFYLVEYHDGWRSSTYGSESVGWPRVLADDTCD